MTQRISNGQLTTLDPSAISFEDPAVQYGMLGFFETLRVDARKVQLFKAHLDRLARSADQWRIGWPAPMDLLIEAIKREVHWYAPDAILRLKITLGPDAGAGTKGDSESVPGRIHVSADLLPQLYRGSMSSRPKYRLQIFRDFHLASTHPFSGHKVSQHWLYWEARRRARIRGYDETILLNERGELVEASAFNLFWIADSTLFTPALECGGLQGVFAAHVAEIAASKGIPVEPARAAPEALTKAEAVFLTNSLAELSEVKTVEDKAFSPLVASDIGSRILAEIERRRTVRHDLEIT